MDMGVRGRRRGPAKCRAALRKKPKATAASSALCIVFRIGRRYNAETTPRKVEKYPAT
jgi:hypothetical protein